MRMTTTLDSHPSCSSDLLHCTLLHAIALYCATRETPLPHQVAVSSISTTGSG